MDCIYIALSKTQWPPKRFTVCLTFTHIHKLKFTQHLNYIYNKIKILTSENVHYPLARLSVDFGNDVRQKDQFW